MRIINGNSLTDWARPKMPSKGMPSLERARVNSRTDTQVEALLCKIAAFVLCYAKFMVVDGQAAQRDTIGDKKTRNSACSVPDNPRLVTRGKRTARPRSKEGMRSLRCVTTAAS